MKLKILLFIGYLKENWLNSLDILFKAWLILSLMLVNGYIGDSLKIPFFLTIGISFGIGWNMTRFLFPPKREINIFINKEVLEEIKKLP